LLHVFDSLLFERLYFEKLKYVPGLKYGSSRTFEYASIETLHNLLKIVFLNRDGVTLKLSSILSTLEALGLTLLKNPDSSLR
jgi:hypothetical protein